MPQRESLLKRLSNTLRMNTGSAHNHDDDFFDDAEDTDVTTSHTTDSDDNDFGPRDAQLAVDVYDAGDAIILKTMIAGVHRNDLDINLTRETITIRGTRDDRDAPSDEYYLYQELFWGSFSRRIDLPAEIDIDRAEALEESGLLTLKLPKIDKSRSTRIELRSK